MNIYDSAACRGYFFINTYKMRGGGGECCDRHLILDGRGDVIYYRKISKSGDFKLQPDGRMTYYHSEKFMILDKDFNVVDSAWCRDGATTDSHDFRILPNGNYLMIGTRTREADLKDKKLFMKNGSPGSAKAKVKTGVVQETDSAGKVVYEWDSAPWYNIEDASRFYLTDSVNVDLTHFNSIDYDKEGNFIISVRFFNEVIKVDRKSGKPMWRLGGKNSDFRLMKDTVFFLGQHYARLAGNNRVGLFDNGYSWPANNHSARMIEYETDLKAKTATVTKSLVPLPGLVSEAGGSSEVLPNGMTLFSFGKVLGFSPNITAMMLEPEGFRTMDLAFGDTLGSYRIYHYASLPFKIRRPAVKIIPEDGSCVLEAPADMAYYQWSTGESTRKIRVKDAGTYFVFVPAGTAGYVRSETVSVTKKMFVAPAKK